MCILTYLFGQNKRKSSKKGLVYKVTFEINVSEPKTAARLVPQLSIPSVS